MRTHRAIWEVARREIVERSRSRVLRISVLVLLLASIGGSVAAARLDTSGTPTDDVGLVGARSSELAPAITAQAHSAGRRVHLHTLATAAAASRQVRDGTLDAALIDGSRIVVDRSRTTAAAGVLQDAVAAQTVLTRLRTAGLTRAQALAALTPQPLPVSVLEPTSHSTERNRGFLYVGMLALFVALISFGQTIAASVTEEKASRVVELLLTTVSPRRLLTGKVFGVGVLGLAVLVVLAGSALIAGALAGGAGLPSAAPEAAALVVLWFVLGYVLFSVAYAAVGALVSRQEDLQTAMTPVNFLMIGAWILAIVALGDPNGTLATIAAFVPPFQPMVVPARMVLGDMGALALIAAVAIDVLATAGLIVLAARIYERAILRIGAPVKLRRVLADREPAAQGRLAGPRIDLALRAVAVVLLLAGALIGFSKPPAIVALVLGLVLIAVLEARKRGWHGPAH